MRGTFIAVVGPSGAGKDTLINAAVAARTDLVRARRVIAPPRATVGEDAEMIDEAAFEARCHSGDFALDWLAHGYRYAIPASVEAALEQGRHVVANISRNSLAEAAGRFSPFLAIHIDTAPKVLAARLAARGRETEAEILRRLERAERKLPEGVPVVTVDNSGPVQAAMLAFTAALPAPLPAETAR